MTELKANEMVDIVKPETVKLGQKPETVSVTLPEKMPLSALFEKVTARAAEMEKQLADIATKSEAMEAIVEGIVENAMETVTDEVNYYTDQEVEEAKESMGDRIEETVNERVEAAAEEAVEKYVEGRFVAWLADKNFKVVLDT